MMWWNNGMGWGGWVLMAGLMVAPRRAVRERSRDPRA